MDYNFERGNFTESELEEAIIELFKQQGYDYIFGENMHRMETDILLKDDLRAYIENRYASEYLSEAEIQKIIDKLELISSVPLYEGNREAFRLVNAGFDLSRDDHTKTALHVDFIDYDNPERNCFTVINQYSVLGSTLRRPDLLVFINGIPVAIFEFKSAIREDATIHDAWEQIAKRYCRDIPKLMKYCFLSVISDGANTRMGSIFTPYIYYYAWNKANDEDQVANGISSLFTMIEGAFSKERVLAILRDFVFYPDDSHKNEVMVCRYPQFFAANKMFENIKHHLKPSGDGKGGTYFGATGCGKTFAMLCLARLLMQRDNDTFHNPTIILITDRDDLDEQAAQLFVTAKKFLGDEDVRGIDSRDDLRRTLQGKQSGGVYMTTIQKFCEDIGLLSDRTNIVCISDEAHRTQTNIGSNLKIDETGVRTSYGFANYLRRGFPNATYCGFSGTPIDETFAVFGPEVDRYTMEESCRDGITVDITYVPRIARVILSDDQAKQIEKYYERCSENGSTDEQVRASQMAMSSMSVILSDPDVIERLAADIVEHYEGLCAEKPGVVQKAMIVCVDRMTAFKVLKAILKIRPEWGEARKTDDESKLTSEQLDRLLPLAKINLVATQGNNDEEELYNLCGDKEHRKMLDNQFKNDNSNFKIAVVVDMWVTGFDIPSLAVMYIYKPIQKHTLIQTISRVNRVYDGKEKGIIVDYIGIEKNMNEALKTYGSDKTDYVQKLSETTAIFRNYLKTCDELFSIFNPSRYYNGNSLERLQCLNAAAEYVQTKKELENRFLNASRILRNAYNICAPSGELEPMEIAKAQFYFAVRSIVYKQTNGDAPDVETMNEAVEKMVQEAISCSGVESVIYNNRQSIDINSEEFRQRLDSIKMPITKFNALLKLLRKEIANYGKKNRIKKIEFDKRLREVVDRYNKRDDVDFTNDVMSDFMDRLSDQLMSIYSDLMKDEKSFEDLGISFDEKVFYDILISVRDDHGFDYENTRCVKLAKKIKEAVDDNSKYTDWSKRDDIKAKLQSELLILLNRNGYPPTWSAEVFEKVLEQTENYKKYSQQ